jgi:hypothetical protein
VCALKWVNLCRYTWDVVFVKENRVGGKKTDTAGTSDRLCAVTPEELEEAVARAETERTSE